MRGKFILVCFILLIPALLALGHDIYISYFSDPEKVEQVKALDIEASSFKLSDLGYLWINYAPKSFDWAREHFEPSTWKNYLDPLLRQSTVVVGLAIAVFGYLVMLFMWLFGLGAFKGRTLVSKKVSVNNAGIYGKTRKGEFKYKRK